MVDEGMEIIQADVPVAAPQREMPSAAPANQIAPVIVDDNGHTSARETTNDLALNPEDKSQPSGDIIPKPSEEGTVPSFPEDISNLDEGNEKMKEETPEEVDMYNLNNINIFLDEIPGPRRIF